MEEGTPSDREVMDLKPTWRWTFLFFSNSVSHRSAVNPKTGPSRRFNTNDVRLKWTRLTGQLRQSKPNVLSTQFDQKSPNHNDTFDFLQ